jgi:hypothetical protein
MNLQIYFMLGCVEVTDCLALQFKALEKFNFALLDIG